MTRQALVRLALCGIVLAGLAFVGWFMMIRMPGTSYAGPLPPLTADEATVRDALKRDVEELAGRIGERNLRRYAALTEAADFIEQSMLAAGYGRVERQSFTVEDRACDNLAVEIDGTGRPGEIVVVGAHYDSVIGAPGANDNASGVAATLALARRFAGTTHARTLRFVAFVNEEPPHFQTGTMGSVVYARGCRQRGDNVVAMISLETVGYYSDAEGSQAYPPPFSLFYPSTGNFIGFVGNVSSRRLVRDALASFRAHAKFPSEGAAIPSVMPGVGWSDHWAFWQQGYSAIMVTDTAPFRYPHYHSADDTPDKLDYDRMARVVVGLAKVIEDLTQ